MATREPVETKVTAASVAAYLASTALLAVLTAVQTDAGLIAGFPDLLEAPVLALLPTALVFAAGWKARHTPRRPTGI